MEKTAEQITGDNDYVADLHSLLEGLDEMARNYRSNQKELRHRLVYAIMASENNIDQLQLLRECILTVLEDNAIEHFVRRIVSQISHTSTFEITNPPIHDEDVGVNQQTNDRLSGSNDNSDENVAEELDEAEEVDETDELDGTGRAYGLNQLRLRHKLKSVVVEVDKTMREFILLKYYSSRILEENSSAAFLNVIEQFSDEIRSQISDIQITDISIPPDVTNDVSDVSVEGVNQQTNDPLSGGNDDPDENVEGQQQSAKPETGRDHSLNQERLKQSLAPAMVELDRNMAELALLHDCILRMLEKNGAEGLLHAIEEFTHEFRTLFSQISDIPITDSDVTNDSPLFHSPLLRRSVIFGGRDIQQTDDDLSAVTSDDSGLLHAQFRRSVIFGGRVIQRADDDASAVTNGSPLFHAPSLRRNATIFLRRVIHQTDDDASAVTNDESPLFHAPSLRRNATIFIGTGIQRTDDQLDASIMDNYDESVDVEQQSDDDTSPDASIFFFLD